MSAGFDDARFWLLTPKEIAMHFEAFARRQMREHNERAWLAWHVEALARSKRLPKLKTLLVKPKAKAVRQSWEQQLAIAKAWQAALDSRRKN